MCTWFHFCCGMKQLGRCSQVLDRVFSSGKHCNSSNLEACTAYRVRCNVDWVCIIFCCPCYSDVVPTCITGGRILLVVYQGAHTNHGTHPSLENMIISSPLPDACWWTYHVVGKVHLQVLWRLPLAIHFCSGSIQDKFSSSALLSGVSSRQLPGCGCRCGYCRVWITTWGTPVVWDKGNILVDIFKEMFVKSALFPWWSSW